MQYYYAVSSEEVKGPVSEDVLKNLFFQRRLSLSSLVILSGDSDWRTLGDLFPDLEFYRGCPKCLQKITVEVERCPHCSFPIAEYEENLRSSRRRPAPKHKVSYDQIVGWIKKELAIYNSGCFLLVGIVLGLVLLIIPFIGWVFGPLTIIVCFLSFIVPWPVKLWWYRNLNTEGYDKLAQKALEALSSPLVGHCPKCNQIIEEKPIFAGDSCKCPHCSGELFLQDGMLYYLPFPKSVVSPAYSQLFKK
jgi:hypothetical protein